MSVLRFCKSSSKNILYQRGGTKNFKSVMEHGLITLQSQVALRKYEKPTISNITFIIHPIDDCFVVKGNIQELIDTRVITLPP